MRPCLVETGERNEVHLACEELIHLYLGETWNKLTESEVFYDFIGRAFL
jgi:hypothetical protein